MSVDLRTSVIILESNDKKMQYYSKAIISLCHYWAIWYWFLNKLCHNLHFCLRLTFNTASRRKVQYHTDTRTRFTQPQTCFKIRSGGALATWVCDHLLSCGSWAWGTYVVSQGTLRGFDCSAAQSLFQMVQGYKPNCDHSLQWEILAPGELSISKERLWSSFMEVKEKRNPAW